MSYLFNTILYKPFLNALVALYTTVALHDLGLSIILLTIIIRFILFPLFQKSIHHQTVMQQLQPKIKVVQEKHAKDREAQAKALMELYKEHDINPFSGFLFILIQLPILIALYQIARNSLREGFFSGLYPFLHAPAVFAPSFFGLINLQERNIILVILTAAAQFLQGKLSLPQGHGGTLSQAERMSRQMVYMAPLLTVFIFFNLPSAVVLYWFTTSVFSIFQQLFINRKLRHGKLGTLPQTINQPPRLQ